MLLGGVPAFAQSSAKQIVYMTMTAKPMSWPIRPGAATNTWSYEATVRGGQATRAGYLGPILRVPKDAYLSVNFKNELVEDTTVHWHGLDVPAIMDGHPIMAVQPGYRYNYAFRILNRAGTYWFHPHPDMRTGFQVAKGMAGVIIVTDHEEQVLGLPSGSRDLILVLQDRVIDEGNQFLYNWGGAPGFLGGTMVVNGQVDFAQEVDSAVYRIRLLNGSNARIYKLAWSNGAPIVVIGGDHGLLPAAETVPYLMLAPGQRAEIWADFSAMSVGDSVRLETLNFSMGSGGGNWPQGYEMDIAEFRVTRSVHDPRVLPKFLSKIPRYRLEDAANLANPREIPISRVGTEWRLNNAAFEIDNVASNEITRRGVLEVWEFQNLLGTSTMAHPIHLHGSPFQVVERTVSPAWQAAYDTVRHGILDDGWRDTFLIMPGEKVKILTKPEHFTGRFLYHCHNLEHEDMGMMRNFDILP